MLVSCVLCFDLQCVCLLFVCVVVKGSCVIDCDVIDPSVSRVTKVGLKKYGLPS